MVAARDGDDPKAELIALIVAQGQQHHKWKAASKAALERSLKQLGVRELRLRAAADGISADAIEDGMIHSIAAHRYMLSVS